MYSYTKCPNNISINICLKYMLDILEGLKKLCIIGGGLNFWNVVHILLQIFPSSYVNGFAKKTSHTQTSA